MCREVYATTAKAFWDFLDHNQLRERIKLRLKELNVDDVKQLISVGKEIRQWIVESPFQTRLKKSIKDAYKEMSGGDNECSIAVRSSATAEDLPDASFAGQQEDVFECFWY